MISTDRVLKLYERYADDLKEVRRQQYWFKQRHDNPLVRRLCKWGLRRSMLFPALDDVEAEITYMLIRDRRPNVILEMSPNGGWSTSWILSAVRDNANGGQLWSYDVHRASTRLVPRNLTRGRWHFMQGDARTTISDAPDFDYLFIDSDHSEAFAAWYVGHVFPRLRPGTIVSVHDVFHSPEPSEEGQVVIRWLTTKGLTFWTPSMYVGGDSAERITGVKRRLGVDYVIQPRDGHNPMLFFEPSG